MAEVDRLLEEQVAYYRARAPEYDRTSMPEGDPFAEHGRRLRDWLRGLSVSGSVLEIAAGTGQWTGILAESADRLLVTDASPEMLALNRAKHGQPPGVHYRVADAFALKLTQRFDAIFFGFFLSHVPPDSFDRFWDGVSAVLEPDGMAVFIDEGPHEGWNEAWIDEKAGIVHRRLSDGSSYHAVKVLWKVAALEQRLRAIRWETAISADGPFYAGIARPRASRRHVRRPPAPSGRSNVT